MSEKSAINGAIAGIASRTIIAPLDVIKIRLQVQNQYYPQYKGIYDVYSTILKEEGMSGFWKGNLSGLFLYGTYGSIQFSVYQQIKRRVENDFVCGGIAGSVATAVTYPFDILRTRFAIRSEDIRGATLFNTLLRNEGVFGLFKGLLPTLLSVAPYMGTVFACYQTSNSLLGNIPQPLSDFISGSLAGVGGKVATMPLDVVRKRMQIQNGQFDVYQLKNLQKYSSIKECVAFTWLNEGIRGFYRGLGISLLKSVPSTASVFVIYGILSKIR